jgi:ribosome recycling factor
MLGPIEQSIFKANIGLTPMNDGELIRITIPPLTEERRKEMVKKAKDEGENAKISLRSARHKVMDFIKKAVKDGLSEDLGKIKEKEIQEMVDNYTNKINHLVEAKEKDIMTV